METATTHPPPPPFTKDSSSSQNVLAESRPILFALFLSHTIYNYAVWTEQAKTIVGGRTDNLERIVFSIVFHYTGSLSSKYEHRLLRSIRNIRICMGKKPIVSVNYENERISLKKNSLPYLKSVLRLSYVVHGPIYGRFMGFYVNGFLSI